LYTLYIHATTFFGQPMWPLSGSHAKYIQGLYTFIWTFYLMTNQSNGTTLLRLENCLLFIMYWCICLSCPHVQAPEYMSEVLQVFGRNFAIWQCPSVTRANVIAFPVAKYVHCCIEK